MKTKRPKPTSKGDTVYGDTSELVRLNKRLTIVWICIGITVLLVLVLYLF